MWIVWVLKHKLLEVNSTGKNHLKLSKVVDSYNIIFKISDVFNMEAEKNGT